MNSSSVYLTPESSPAKEQSNVVNVDDDGLSLDSQILESKLTKTHVSSVDPPNGYVHVHDKVVLDEVNDIIRDDASEDVALTGEKGTCNGAEDEMISVPVAETANNTQDEQVAEDSTPIEEFGTPVLSHSVESHNTRKKVNPSGKLSLSSAEPASVSSPSLPRPKVRKGAQLKKPSIPADVPATESSQMQPKPGRRK